MRELLSMNELESFCRRRDDIIFDVYVCFYTFM